jgi:hypothetical protein
MFALKGGIRMSELNAAYFQSVFDRCYNPKDFKEEYNRLKREIALQHGGTPKFEKLMIHMDSLYELYMLNLK